MKAPNQRLGYKETVAIADWIKTNYSSIKSGAAVQAARRATDELGFKVHGDQLRKIAVGIDMPVRRPKKPVVKKVHKPAPEVTGLEQRLADLEEQVNRIFGDLYGIRHTKYPAEPLAKNKLN